MNSPIKLIYLIKIILKSNNKERQHERKRGTKQLNPEESNEQNGQSTSSSLAITLNGDGLNAIIKTDSKASFNGSCL
jgi:hypothetical protein